MPFNQSELYGEKVSQAGKAALLVHQTDRPAWSLRIRGHRGPERIHGAHGESEGSAGGHAPGPGPSLMRLGIISDTHGLLRPEVFDAFAGVDHILHAGDVGSLDLLDRASRRSRR